MEYQSPFGRWLKDRRKALDITQQDLARRTNYSTAAIHKIEAGAVRPSRAMAAALAQALDVPAEERDTFLAFARGLDVRHKLNHLPTPLTPILGRERALADLKALLARSDVRLVTLAGPPGVGKTRLAVQAAHDLHPSMADGAVFIALAPVQATDFIPVAIANALQARVFGAEPALQTIARFLEPRELLLVLDNFEHVLDGAAVVSWLLERCPRVRALVTSRAVLGLEGENVFEVKPLDLAPAVELFARHATSVKPEFELDHANRETVERICRALDRLPLAIELAAARARMLSPKRLLERLHDRPGARLDLLTSGSRDWPERQRTLRATIEWSHALLTPDEQRFFRRLAAFAGSCTVEAAAAVCEDDGALLRAEDHVQSLLEKSLLFETEGLDGAPRYNQFEMLQEYALERLQAAGEVDAMRRRLTEYLVRLTEAARPYVAKSDQIQWLRRLASERDNVSAALDWCRTPTGDDALGLRLAGGIGWVVAWGSQWKIYMPIAEAQYWMDGLWKRILAVPPEEQAVTAYGVLDMVQAMGKLDLVLAQTEILRDLAQRTNDRFIAWALHWSDIISIHLVGGDFERAVPSYEALIADAGADEMPTALGKNVYARVLGAHGQADRAVRLAEEALAAYRKHGVTWTMFGGTSTSQEYLANALVWAGDFARAQLAAERAWRDYAQVGWYAGEVASAHWAALAALAAGHADAFAAHAERLFRLAPVPPKRLRIGGQVAKGDALGLIRCVRHALAHQRDALPRGVWPPVLYILGGQFGLRDDAASRARAWGAARAMLPSVRELANGETLYELMRDHLSDARIASLDDTALAAAWESGERMTLDEIAAWQAEDPKGL